MDKVNRYLKKMVRDHHTVAFVGIMFIIMGLINLNDHLLENILGMKIKLGHGFILMGAFNVMLSFTFLINGISTVEASIDDKKPHPDIEKIQKEMKHLESKVHELEKILNQKGM